MGADYRSLASRPAELQRPPRPPRAANYRGQRVAHDAVESASIQTEGVRRASSGMTGAQKESMRTRSSSSAKGESNAAWNQRAIETTAALRSRSVSSSRGHRREGTRVERDNPLIERDFERDDTPGAQGLDPRPGGTRARSGGD